MRLSTKTILVLGVIQCIILTLILILFMQWQKGIQEEMGRASMPHSQTQTRGAQDISRPDVLPEKEDSKPRAPLPPRVHNYPAGIEPL